MKIRDLLSSQTERSRILLIRQGLFFRGYNEGAILLNSTMQYSLKRKEIKSCGGDVCYCGFPSDSMGKVLDALTKNGAKLIDKTENLLELSVIDFNSLQTQLALVMQNIKPNVMINYDSVISQLREYRLDFVTPIEVVNFVNGLKDEILTIDKR